jgi:hypothetical protein
MDRIKLVFAKGGILDQYLAALEIATEAKEKLGYIPSDLKKTLETLESRINKK